MGTTSNTHEGPTVGSRAANHWRAKLRKPVSSHDQKCLEHGTFNKNIDGKPQQNTVEFHYINLFSCVSISGSD